MQLSRKTRNAIAVVILGVVTTFVTAVLREIDDSLLVAFLDVGQGDAIFIESPSGRQVLIDGGAGKRVLSELSVVMPWYDRSIDVVINTHPDKDHIGGLPEVLRMYDVSLVMDPGVESDSGTYGFYRQLIEKQEVRYVEARRGQVIDLGSGAYLKILYPDRDMDGVSNDNNASVVAQLVFGETEVMLTGDAPKSVEQYLVTLDGDTLASDILKAGHHGSRTSSSGTFVKTVAPRWAIISAGKDNSYHHPHKEAVDLFASSSIEMLGTYNLGTIVFRSDGMSFSGGE